MTTQGQPTTSAQPLSAGDLIRGFDFRLLNFTPEQLREKGVSGAGLIIWSLFKTMLLPTDRPTEAAKVQAAKELAERVWGRVPSVERQEKINTLADLDLSRLKDGQAAELLRLIALATEPSKPDVEA